MARVTLQDVMEEQAAIRSEMQALMHRLEASEAMIQQLGGCSTPAPPASRATRNQPVFDVMQQSSGGPSLADRAPKRPQTAPARQPAREPPRRVAQSSRQAAAAELQSRSLSLTKAVNDTPSMNHWEEPGEKTSPTSIDMMENSLRQAFGKSREFQKNPDNPLQSLTQLFNRLDVNHSGKIDRREFQAVVKSLGFEGDSKVMNALFNRYDLNNSNVLDIQIFGKMLFSTDFQGKSLNIMARIREGLSIRAGGFESLRAMARQFRIADRDDSGVLNRQEFDVAFDIFLNCFKIKLSQADKNNLFTHFDRDQSGTVSYDEFVREIRGPMNSVRESFVQQAFAILDREGSGLVDERDVANIYDVSTNPSVKSGKMSEVDALNLFLTALGGESGQITWEQFKEHYEWVSSSIDNDDYFELMMRNAWHISGGQGWAENTSDLRVLVRHSDGSEEVVELQNDMSLPLDPKQRYNEVLQRLAREGVRDISKVEFFA